MCTFQVRPRNPECMEDTAGAGLVQQYFGDLRRILDDMQDDMERQIPRMAQRLEQARQEDRMVYVMGNGGSAAAASHLANDINKYTVVEGARRYRAIALTDAVPLMTAVANDISYADVFREQLRNFARPGDVLIGISGSGNSENCVRAMQYAREQDVTTISWTGYGGGRMADLAELRLVIPSDSMVRCEDLHVMIHHCLATLLVEQVRTVTVDA